MRRFPKELLKEFPEFEIFKKLNSPAAIQDFLETIPINFEEKRSTLRSPLMVLRRHEAQCVEGAMLAAAILWYHGEPPWLMDLITVKHDHPHVVALFKRDGLWGALSKTNHAVLRYRDPVFRTPRELAMSYFNEYFLNNGEKTLRSYSGPFDVRAFDDSWLTTREHLWKVTDALDHVKHYPVLGPRGARNLRKADPLEIKAGKLVERKKRRTS